MSGECIAPDCGLKLDEFEQPALLQTGLSFLFYATGGCFGAGGKEEDEAKDDYEAPDLVGHGATLCLNKGSKKNCIGLLAVLLFIGCIISIVSSYMNAEVFYISEDISIDSTYPLPGIFVCPDSVDTTYSDFYPKEKSFKLFKTSTDAMRDTLVKSKKQNI